MTSIFIEDKPRFMEDRSLFLFFITTTVIIFMVPHTFLPNIFIGGGVGGDIARYIGKNILSLGFSLGITVFITNRVLSTLYKKYSKISASHKKEGLLVKYPDSVVVKYIIEDDEYKYGYLTVLGYWRVKDAIKNVKNTHNG
ncbi:MAG: hypothetical protein ACJAS1_000837 [Oleiphilaceae bacterium]|jgi:hypothetical protein